MSLVCVQLSHTQNKIQAFHHSLRDYELAPTSLPQSSAHPSTLTIPHFMFYLSFSILLT